LSARTGAGLDALRQALAAAAAAKVDSRRPATEPEHTKDAHVT
jgi:hypothetical protein